MWAPQRQVGFLRIWLYRQEEIGRMQVDVVNPNPLTHL